MPPHLEGGSGLTPGTAWQLGDHLAERLHDDGHQPDRGASNGAHDWVAAVDRYRSGLTIGCGDRSTKPRPRTLVEFTVAESGA